MNGQKQYREDLLEWCHETSKSLCEQLELLYRESNAYQEEIEVDSVNRFEMEEQFQSEEEYLETNAFQDEMQIEIQYIDTEELNKYHWIYWNGVISFYSNWNRTKLRLSNVVDHERKVRALV